MKSGLIQASEKDKIKDNHFKQTKKKLYTHRRQKEINKNKKSCM